MTKAEFEEQKRVLKEHEEQKRKNDLQKAKREVKQALGESITAAEQQRVLDKIKSQAETGRKQGNPDQSNLDVGRKDMRRQRSLQPHIYDTIPGGTGNDSANIRRRLGNQGKSSSGDHERAQMHKNLHESNLCQGGPPLQQQQYGDNCYHSGQALVDPQGSKQLGPDYHVNIVDPELFQKYIQPNPDAQPMPPDHAGASHHHIAGGTGGSASQYTDQPGHGLHQGQAQHGIQSSASQYMDQPSGSHHQQNFAAATVPPGSSSTVNINPNLMVNSRIQMPTASPTEPFKYGIIRWIGEIPGIQGLVAGIEMASALYYCNCYV